MKASIIFFTDKGSNLSLKIATILRDNGWVVEQYGLEKHCKAGQTAAVKLGELSGRLFSECKLLVYIGALGIAVRYIAPWIRDKQTDPAVICVDELGKFTISVLSGHIGGANRLTEQIAEQIGACSVVTTATDINNLPAIDEWAVNNGLFIADIKKAKTIAAELVAGRCVGIYSQYDILGQLPKGIIQSGKELVGIVIVDNQRYTPFEETLFLHPKNVCLGIGCRRGTAFEAIEQAVLSKLQEFNIPIDCLVGLASVDLKQDEIGLLQFAKKYSLDTCFYSAEELNEVQGSFAKSEFVQKTVGVDNVCERAALKLSENGKILLPKTARNGITIALAIKKYIIKF